MLELQYATGEMLTGLLCVFFIYLATRLKPAKKKNNKFMYGNIENNIEFISFKIEEQQ